MEEKTLYGMESRVADFRFLFQTILLLILFVTSIFISHFYYALAVGILLGGYIVWRWIKGPLLGRPQVQIGPVKMIFNDRVFTGTKVFNIEDIHQLSLIGPVGNRKIRIHTKTGADEVVYQAIRGKQLVRIVEFLRSNLPDEIVLEEQEPPTWANSIRGDF